MSVQMTKRGQQDNISTYEFICDSTSDLQNIDPKYINLGSIATVIKGNTGLEIYIANSNKEWISLMISDGSQSSSDDDDDTEITYRSTIEKEINFIDYDGTIAYSYTVQEFLALEALPANPVHEGLISEGWNWTLADAQAYARKYPKMFIGQHYVTSDGKTKCYVRIKANTELNFEIIDDQDQAIDGLTIDWGDGTEITYNIDDDTWQSHTYEYTGDYLITFDSDKIRYITPKNNTDQYIRYIQIGSGDTVFQCEDCACLETITIPKNFKCDSSIFEDCYTLKSITIPPTMTQIPEYMCCYCQNLRTVSLPNTITSIGQISFFYCYSLHNIHLPNTVTNIGEYAFYYDLNLILHIPESVESIEEEAIGHCNTIYAYASTPPSLESNSSIKLYVPNTSNHNILNAYTNATNWSMSNIIEWEVPSYD